MCIRLLVAFEDGTTIDEEFPDHDYDSLVVMVTESEDSLLIRVDIEDSKSNLLYQYKRKVIHGY